MTRIAFIRHGRTPWNAEGRMQGQTDIPLSDEGHAEIKATGAAGLNPVLAGYAWITSPLKRARTTAALLCGYAPPHDAALTEMNWGDWEGRTLASLREELGDELQANEDKGLDFRPVGGESPREVQDRIRAWMAKVHGTKPAIAAVCHKGVIRAVMAMAHDWDMMGKPPVKLDWTAAHLFDVAGDGTPHPVAMNVPIARNIGTKLNGNT